MSSPPLGLRKSGEFMAVSTAPSINKTPLGKIAPAIGYQVSADLSNSVGVIPNVRFNGRPAVVFDQSTQPNCTGDEAGSLGGIFSGTCGGEVKPASHSKTVRIGGKPAMRIGDKCTLNNGNCPGVYVSVPPPEGDNAKPVSLDAFEFDEKAGERSFLEITTGLIGRLDLKALRHFKDGVNTALDGAVESSGYNPFVMAFCSIGVALNEVFVPENLLDISPSKPLNLFKKGAFRAARGKKVSDGLTVKGEKERNLDPPGKRKDHDSKKTARESAQRAGKGKPIHHYDGEHGHHYHPVDKKGRQKNHDHYYYKRRK